MIKDKFSGRYRSGLNSLFVPNNSPFQINYMSIYPNVTQQDLINLSKLAEQQKNQGATKIKSRILIQTHDIKLAENLPPITTNLKKVNESTQKLGDIKKRLKF